MCIRDRCRAARDRRAASASVPGGGTHLAESGCGYGSCSTRSAPPGILRVMSRGAVVTVVVAVAIRSGAAAPEREPDTLPVPPVPAAASSATVELPAVPSFELAPAEPGLHDVRELRVRGRALLGSELTVSGYIVWIYDCLTALAKPGMTIVELQERIDDNPGLCERPKFALGASPTASLEAALWG